MNSSPGWLTVFPDHLRSLLLSLPPSVFHQLEEIRVRDGRPLEINAKGQYWYITDCGEMTMDPMSAYKPNREDHYRLLDLMTNHSVYTMEEELRRGFITIEGGHRVGLAGRTVLSGGKVEHLRDISGYNFRLAREIKGIAEPILPHLLDFRHRTVKHTLFLSSPQQGKTTLLRDIARLISYGKWGHPDAAWPGLKVGIVDERSEIAACKTGRPSFDVGPRTDVLDGCPKAEGLMMMIRSMSPEVLIVDEIGRPEDVEALAEALHAGVRVIATVHGSTIEDLLARPALAQLMESSFFQLYVALKRSERHMMFKLWDERQRPILLRDQNEPVRGGRA